MRIKRPHLSILIVCTIAFASTAVTQVPRVRGATTHPHTPIFINGNGNFTSANGVVSGSGTVSDPYVIQEWEINAPTVNGVEIRDTTAHFVVRNLVINANGQSNNGMLLYGAFGGTIERSSIGSASSSSSRDSWAVSIVESANITLTGDMINPPRYANGEGIFIDRSTGITVSGDTAYGVGVALGPSQANVIDIFNSVTVRVENTQIQGLGSTGSIINSTKVTITNSRFAGGDGSDGLDISDSREVEVTGSSAGGGFCGVFCFPNGFTGRGNHQLKLLNDEGGQTWIEGTNITISHFTASTVSANGSNITL